MPSVSIVEYTDPGCPFAFSAEPHRLRVQWLYGDGVRFEVRMVGLSNTRQDNADKGLTPEMIAKGARGLRERYGMPITDEVREAVPATMPACRAVIAARLHAPDRELRLLRALRVHAMTAGMLDDPALIDAAATDAGIDPAELAEWVQTDAVAEALAEDMRLARDPSPAALALPDKLARDGDGWRYTCPSYELSLDGSAYAVPGIQSSLNYETAIANLAPDLPRRPAPEDPKEVLEWAGFPLATQEVAEILGTDRETARERLREAGATERPAANDAYWTA